MYHSKHPNPTLCSGAGGQLGDWKVRTGVTGETSEHEGFLLSLTQFFLVGIVVGRLSVPAPHCKTCLCEAVAVTLQMLLKNFSPGGAGGLQTGVEAESGTGELQC